eukprot:COSAG02_NODE_2996_length_7581_cov_35.324111_1_plen_97_part_10
MRLSVCNCMYISMSYTYSKYEFLCPDSGVVRSSFRSVQVLRAFADVRPEFSMGNLPIAIPVETSLNRPFPGTKLDMPRLDPPRGPARGRARANLRDL